MFKENIENVKLNLQDRMWKSFFVIISSYASFLFFLLSCISCLYLLVINTGFFKTIGVFDSNYIHATVCALAVFENIVLFMFYIYLRLKKDIYFCFFEYGLDFKITLRHTFEAFYVYLQKSVRKFIAFLFFFCPVFIISLAIYSFLQTGVSYAVLTLFAACDLLFLISGAYSYFIYVQKYELISYVLIKYDHKNIKSIFDLSEKLTEGNCRKLFKLKLCNIPKKLLCFAILPAIYFLPYCKALESDVVLSKEKPYLRKHADTEKSVVFYFKPLKEN